MKVDIAIVGGGIVGLLSSYILKEIGYKVLGLESKNIENYDQRYIALSYTSKEILKSFPIWKDIKSISQNITDIHISDKGYFGFTHISSKDINIPELGCVVSLYKLNKILKKYNKKNYLFSAKVLSIDNINNKEVNIKFIYNQKINELKAKLILLANGSDSLLIKKLGIKIYQKLYNQTAIVSNIDLEINHNNVAYERFTSTGSIAILPCAFKKASLIWCLSSNDSKKMMLLNDKEFIHKLQNFFGYRLGTFKKISKRTSFDLQMSYPKKLIKKRILLFGNSAHHMHPIAAQGLNLTIRDLKCLANIINFQNDPGNIDLLKKYISLQKYDHYFTIKTTDLLIKIFESKSFFLIFLRNSALLFFDYIPFLNTLIAKHMMGINVFNLFKKECKIYD